MRFTFPFLAALAMLLSACSGQSGKSSPITPTVSPESVVNPAPSNRLVLGMWDVTISEDRQVVEVAPMRGVQLHLNAVKLLETNPCKDCLTVGTEQDTDSRNDKASFPWTTAVHWL
jgi:hypothetical protein